MHQRKKDETLLKWSISEHRLCLEILSDQPILTQILWESFWEPSQGTPTDILRCHPVIYSSAAFLNLIN